MMEGAALTPDRPRVVPAVRLAARILVGLYATWLAVAFAATASGWYLPVDINSSSARLFTVIFILTMFAVIAAVGWKAIQLTIGRGVAR